jgi:hypothetical protein
MGSPCSSGSRPDATLPLVAVGSGRRTRLGRPSPGACLGLVLRSTATSWRRTSNSMSFRDDDVSEQRQPLSCRLKIGRAGGVTRPRSCLAVDRRRQQLHDDDALAAHHPHGRVRYRPVARVDLRRGTATSSTPGTRCRCGCATVASRRSTSTSTCRSACSRARRTGSRRFRWRPVTGWSSSPTASSNATPATRRRRHTRRDQPPASARSRPRARRRGAARYRRRSPRRRHRRGPRLVRRAAAPSREHARSQPTTRLPIAHPLRGCSAGDRTPASDLGVTGTAAGSTGLPQERNPLAAIIANHLGLRRSASGGPRRE